MASYVQIVNGPFVKGEPMEIDAQEHKTGASASIASHFPSASHLQQMELATIFFELLEAGHVQAQIELEKLAKSWGPMQLAAEPRVGASRSRARDKSVDNIYWPAQQAFLSAIDQKWDHCVKPVVSGPCWLLSSAPSCRWMCLCCSFI